MYKTFLKKYFSLIVSSLQRKKIFKFWRPKRTKFAKEIFAILYVSKISSKGGETKDFFERSHTFSSFTDHPFSWKLSSIILRVVTVTRKEAIKSYERRNYVLYDGEEKERRMRKKRKRMSKRTNRPFPPKGRKNRLKYSTRSLGGRSNEEEILKKNLLRVSQLRGNTEPFARSAI